LRPRLSSDHSGQVPLGGAHPLSMPHPSLTAAQLRRELNARAEAYARSEHLLHELAPGANPSVLFGVDGEGRHGNFHPAAHARIVANPEWGRRLTKAHTASRRSRARKDWRWMELDAAVSSDALLMNIFCHPGVFDGETLAREVVALLNVDAPSHPRFGLRPGVPMRNGRLDRTEIDLVLSADCHADAAAAGGALLLEAKLTESDFQTAAPALLSRYTDLETVFEVTQLPRKVLAPPPLAPNIDPDDPTVNLPARTTRTRMAGYQLVRNVLAAYAANASFCVLLDGRRRDLIEQWFAVLAAVHAPDFRWRLKLLTWQELATALPFELQHFLNIKYGISPG
jgi:hypothetical protein